jgi:hypothetical protein
MSFHYRPFLFVFFLAYLCIYACAEPCLAVNRTFDGALYVCQVVGSAVESVNQDDQMLWSSLTASVALFPN